MSAYPSTFYSAMFCDNIWKRTLLCAIVLTVMLSSVNSEMFLRFEYKLSFVGPHLVLKDGTIPFWEHSGSAIASDESVRVAPSIKSRKGAVWCKENNTHEHWQVEVHFRVSGRGRLGADGLAVWYTATKGEEGPVFGSNDKWNGLGVFFDSFDNDNQHNNPYIMAVVNDGTKEYDHDSDGSSQHLGGCLRDFRNRPYPVKVKIEYFKKALTIYFHNGLTNNNEDFEMCTRVENVDLPANGYFGVTAATGGLADDHDVLAFLAHSLTPIIRDDVTAELPDADKKKIEKEYEEYRDKLEKAKEDYKKDHAQGKTDEIDESKVYESQDARELRLIYEGQNDIVRLIRSSLVKLDEIVGRQERQISMLTMINQHKDQKQGLNAVEKRDLEAISNSQKFMSSDLNDLKQLVKEVSSKLADVKSSDSASTKKLSSSLESLQTDMKVLTKHFNDLTVNSSSGITSTQLVLFLVLHLAALVGYLAYKASREAASKKFY